MNTKIKLLGRGLLIALLTVSSPCLAAEQNPVRISPGEIDLAAREQAVAVREKEVATKEEKLRNLQKEIEFRQERLEKLQKEVADKLAELTAVEDQRLRKLVRVYSSMRPSKVAPLLNRMGDEAVVDIFRAMKTATVAQIIPKLDPDKAVRISKKLGMIK
ncbi:MAG: hypothetical protein P8Y63_01645 [Deltaproteobacteria bacterium]